MFFDQINWENRFLQQFHGLLLISIFRNYIEVSYNSELKQYKYQLLGGPAEGFNPPPVGTNSTIGKSTFRGVQNWYRIPKTDCLTLT